MSDLYRMELKKTEDIKKLQRLLDILYKHDKLGGLKDFVIEEQTGIPFEEIKYFQNVLCKLGQEKGILVAETFSDGNMELVHFNHPAYKRFQEQGGIKAHYSNTKRKAKGQKIKEGAETYINLKTLLVGTVGLLVAIYALIRRSLSI